MDLKFWIQEADLEGLYYLCSKNKGADQLHSYRKAELGLCFGKCKKQVFLKRGSCNNGTVFPQILLVVIK